MSDQLVIFDCDGVLVDTEYITSGFLYDYLLSAGVDADRSEVCMTYRGQKISRAIHDVEQRIGRRVPEDFLERFRRETMATIAKEVQPITGVSEALQAISTAMCVASNGPMEKMKLTLKVTRLDRHFREAVFSAYQVKKWKPDPGLFLHAAEKMGRAPKNCLVVEDSIHGVIAARRAGMRSFAYCPEATSDQERSDFRSKGATLFQHMSELPKLLATA